MCVIVLVCVEQKSRVPHGTMEDTYMILYTMFLGFVIGIPLAGYLATRPRPPILPGKYGLVTS